MEWLRSCYESEWFLFADGPDATPGRYYFSPAGTQFALHPTLLGSRNWLNDEERLLLTLGESIEATHVWNAGTPPAVVPNDDTIGSALCLGGGELLKDHKDLPVVEGFTEACFG